MYFKWFVQGEYILDQKLKNSKGFSKLKHNISFAFLTTMIIKK